jgi:hypothetical protein
MNFGLAHSHCLVSYPHVLRGGKAPLYWKRELSRATERPQSIPRTCDWLTAFAEVCPCLLAEPLFGDCLTAVTASGAARFDQYNELSQPAKRRTSPTVASNSRKPAASERTAFSKRGRLSPSVTSGVAGSLTSQNALHFEKASQLPRQASPSLLRLTGASDTLPATEHLKIKTSTPPRGRPGSAPVNSAPTLTRLEWLNLVADRAAQRWVRNWAFPEKRKSSAPAVARNPSKKSRSSSPDARSQSLPAPAIASSAVVETDAAALPLLQGEWLLPIAGQQATSELLASLVRRASSPTERGTPGRSQQENDRFFNAANAPNAAPRSQTSSPNPFAAEQHPFTNRPDISRPLVKMFEKASPKPEAEPDPRFPAQLNSTINTEEREQQPSPNLAPTILTPSPPPLLPPVSSGSPVVPAAADAARRIAWRDEVEAQEKDLSVLAAQVKRILDEEARRHGIDV